MFRLISVFFILSMSTVSWVYASPVLELMGGDSPDRPWSGRSADHGPATAYFNPARISQSSQVARFSYLISVQQLKIDFEPRPAGYDVPNTVYAGRRVQGDALVPLEYRPFATEDLPHPRPTTQDVDATLQTFIFGLTVPIIEDRLSLGFVTTLSAGFLQTQRPFYPDERSQFFGEGLQFEFMGDRLESMMVSTGLSYRLTSNVSLGVGGTLLNRASSVPQIYIPDASDQERAQTTPVIEVEPVIAPHFGILWNVTEDVEVSSAVHLASESRLKGEGRLRFWEFEYPEGQDRLNQPFDLVFAYEPLRLSFGVSFDRELSGDRRLELYGDLLWAQWSSYVPRHGEAPKDWDDTLAGSIGMRMGIGSQSIGWGLNYSPTPVPEQTGRTNYVDNDRVGSQLGWTWRVLGEDYALDFGASAQTQRWLMRSHFKREDASEPILDEFPDAVDARTLQVIPESRGIQSNNVGFPGFSHGGWFHTLIVSVTLVK